MKFSIFACEKILCILHEQVFVMICILQVSSVTISSLQKQGDVDESFFIIRMIGDEYLFESLLYRGNNFSFSSSVTTLHVKFKQILK